eukprot:gene4708-4959_t
MASRNYAAGRPLLLWAVLGAAAAVLGESRLVVGQAATQFLPVDVPQVAENVSERLVYRSTGFMQFWKDHTVRVVVLQGVAAEGSPDIGATGSPELVFSGMPNAILVQSGGSLTFINTIISEIALTSFYQYTPWQPWRNAGAGYPLWPTMGVAPNGTVTMINVVVNYLNPTELDTCLQYTSRVVFGMRQVFGNAQVVTTSEAAAKVLGPVVIPLTVINASKPANSTPADGSARAVFRNVTFNCIPRAKAGGLPVGTLVPAIVVPVVVALLLLAAGLGFFLLRRRRRRRQQEAAKAGSGSVAAPAGPHDLEQGSAGSPGFPTSQDELLLQGTPPFLAGGPSAVSGLTARLGSFGAAGAVDSAAASGSTNSGTVSGVGHVYHAAGIGNSSTIASSSGATGRTLPADELVTSTSMTAIKETERSSGEAADGSGAGGGGSGANSSGAAAAAADEADGKGKFKGSRGLSALLKARSDMAVLRDLKIGPLLGRGSYGRVYKGRWKAVTVAVKIVEHHEGSRVTAASSSGKRINVGREALLATSILHPNVVQTYHISTMTVSQRNALANSWMQELKAAKAAKRMRQSTSSENLAQRLAATGQSRQSDQSGAGGVGAAVDSDGGGRGSEQPDLMETWMIMEFCEKGSLERAINHGTFVRRSDRQPEMIGIFKALLDIASGLDFLHSIGVVHGDLKTANVLLKGSTRDVRGFACKITDFGLSRVLDMDATHISTRTYGTLVYMPAELLLHGRMTQATDIYSFGLMMWELFSSTRVFDEGLSIGQMFYMIAYQGWRPTIPANCPQGYAQLMAACWHEDPEQRPTVQQVMRSLQKLYIVEKQQHQSDRKAAEGSGAPASRVSQTGSGDKAALSSGGGGGISGAAQAENSGKDSGGDRMSPKETFYSAGASSVDARKAAAIAAATGALAAVGAGDGGGTTTAAGPPVSAAGNLTGTVAMPECFQAAQQGIAAGCSSSGTAAPEVFTSSIRELESDSSGAVRRSFESSGGRTAAPAPVADTSSGSAHQASSGALAGDGTVMSSAAQGQQQYQPWAQAEDSETMPSESLFSPQGPNSESLFSGQLPIYSDQYAVEPYIRGADPSEVQTLEPTRPQLPLWQQRGSPFGMYRPGAIPTAAPTGQPPYEARSAAAAGFVEAMEMAATGPPPPGSFSTEVESLPEQLRGWSSVSTGTMPSVVGRPSQLNLLNMNSETSGWSSSAVPGGLMFGSQTFSSSGTGPGTAMGPGGGSGLDHSAPGVPKSPRTAAAASWVGSAGSSRGSSTAGGGGSSGAAFGLCQQLFPSVAISI